MIVNKRQLSDILGVTEETLTQWAKQGMPVVLKRRGSAGNQYESTAVLSWLDAKRQSDSPPTDYETERTRKVKLEADILALQKSQLEGRLIPSEKVEEAWTATMAVFRARMMAMPSILAPALVGLETFIDAETLVRDAIYSALHELSRSDLAAGIAEELDGGDSSRRATAETDDQPVGG